MSKNRTSPVDPAQDTGHARGPNRTMRADVVDVKV